MKYSTTKLILQYCMDLRLFTRCSSQTTTLVASPFKVIINIELLGLLRKSELTYPVTEGLVSLKM